MLIALNACAAPVPVDEAQDDEPSIPEISVHAVNRLGPADRERIPSEVLEQLNMRRFIRGLGPLTLDMRLTAAAAIHARDMSLQNRPWHFGSDGSSPPTRIRRAGYEGRFLGEAISESYDDAQTTLKVWMNDSEAREVVFAENAKDMGIAWYQEDKGKLWWVMIMGGAERSTTTKSVPIRPRSRR